MTIALLYYPAFMAQKYPPRAYALVKFRETPTTLVVEPLDWLAVEQTRERNHPSGARVVLRFRKMDKKRIGGFGGWRLLELFLDAEGATARMRALAVEARKAQHLAERSEET